MRLRARIGRGISTYSFAFALLGSFFFTGPSFCRGAAGVEDQPVYSIELNVKQIEQIKSDLYSAYDQGTISFVHGLSAASQLKKEQLTWINIEYFSSICISLINGKVSARPVSDVAGEVRDGLKRNKGNFAQMSKEDSMTLHQGIAELYCQFFLGGPAFGMIDSEGFLKGMRAEWTGEQVLGKDSLVNYYLNYKNEFNLKLGASFLAWNKQQKDVSETASGLQYQVLRAVKGDSIIRPSATSEVEVHYHGVLLDGKVFDSSFLRGETISFGLNQVIPGWTEGLQLMKPGELFRFFIPYQLAYGPRGNSGIPPYSCLVFDVELFGFD